MSLSAKVPTRAPVPDELAARALNKDMWNVMVPDSLSRLSLDDDQNETFLNGYNSRLSSGVVVLPFTSHAEDWVFKPSLRQAVQATKL